MKEEIENKTMESVKNIKGIEDENNQLKNYLRKLEKQELGFKGLPISELKTRQARNRKLRELKTRAQKALYFAELYGLQISSLGLKGIQAGIQYTLKFSQGTTPPDTYKKCKPALFHRKYIIHTLWVSSFHLWPNNPV